MTAGPVLGAAGLAMALAALLSVVLVRHMLVGARWLPADWTIVAAPLALIAIPAFCVQLGLVSQAGPKFMALLSLGATGGAFLVGAANLAALASSNRSYAIIGTSAVAALLSLGLAVLIFRTSVDVARVRSDHLALTTGRIPNLGDVGWGLRRALGMPTYINTFRKGRIRLTAFFFLANMLMLPFTIWPWSVPGLTFYTLSAGQALGTAVVVAGSVILVGAAAMAGIAVTRAARESAMQRYQLIRTWDARPPILYLRSFVQDREIVPEHGSGLTSFLFRRLGEPRTMDEIILECAAPWAPVIAIGRPRDDLPPLGAARIYVKGEGWREVVEGLAEAAQLIIVVADNTPGITWELEHIITRGHVAKTLFLASPERDSRLEELPAWLLGRLSVPAEYPRSDADKEIPIALACHANGSTWLMGRSRNRSGYATALNWGLYRTFGEAPHGPSSQPLSGH